MQIRKTRINSFLLALRVCYLIVIGGTVPQVSVGQVSLRMVGGLDCDSEQLQVHLEVQNSSDTTLYLGNATFRIQYDPEILEFQDYLSLSFDPQMFCESETDIWFPHNIDASSSPGEIAFTWSFHPDSNSMDCQQLLPQSWVRWGTLWFGLNTTDGDPNLSFVEQDSEEILLSSINSASPNDGSQAYSLSFEENEDLGLLVCEKAQLDGLLSIQGRTDPSVALSVLLFSPDDLETPVYRFEPRVDIAGAFSLTNINVGSYYAYIKYHNTLSRVDRLILNPGENFWEVPILLGGDANDDNRVSLMDFSLLLQSFNRESGDSTYNLMVDFDHSQQVNILDFTILLSNYNQSGEQLSPGNSPQRLSQPPSYDIRKEAILKVVSQENLSNYQMGDTLTLNVWVDPQEIGVDGVEAHLTYNTNVVDLIGVEMGQELELNLLNESSSQSGTISLAAGTFDKPISSSFIFSQLTFLAKGEGEMELGLYDPKEKNSHITHRGFSILQQVDLPELRVFSSLHTNPLEVYPNPSSGLFLVKKPSDSDQGTLRVFDLTGRMIHSFEWCQNCGSSYKLDLPQTGSYLINFQTNQQNLGTIVQIQ